MWFFIEVDNEQDIGIHENRRFEAKRTSCERTSPYGAPSLTMRFEINCIERRAALPITEETDSAPTGKSLEERVKSLEDWTTQMDIEYDANETWKQQMNLRCIKKFDELYSRTEQLSNEHKELKDAFEAECNYYDENIKSIKQDLSELQQAFVKYAICKKTDIPEGEEPDIVEQIKAGEHRLWELRKSADCVAAIANSASETVSLKEYVIKLMSIHTGLNITGIRMCNKTYKIHYNCKEKGIYIELA